MTGAVAGAIVGLLIGGVLSGYVALLDLRKRQAGIRTKAQYHLSLLAVPLICAAIGSFVGTAIAKL